jgi:hypothetical protein
VVDEIKMSYSDVWLESSTFNDNGPFVTTKKGPLLAFIMRQEVSIKCQETIPDL